MNISRIKTGDERQKLIRKNKRMGMHQWLQKPLLSGNRKGEKITKRKVKIASNEDWFNRETKAKDGQSTERR